MSRGVGGDRFKAQRALWAYGATTLLCVLPPLWVTYPPATDLPQHLAQVAQAVRGEVDPGHTVAWFAPNNLVYLPILLLWQLVGPERVAGCCLALLAALWVLSHFAVAVTFRRPLLAAALASVLFYNGILYWGMLNFMLAWPVFLLWYILFSKLVTSDGRFEWRLYPWLVLCTFLLAWSHVLALGLSGIVGLALSLRGALRLPLRTHLVRLTSFAPCVVLTLPWVAALSQQREDAGFIMGAIWSQTLLARLRTVLLDTVSSGDKMFNVLMFFVLLVWIAGGVRWHRKKLDARATVTETSAGEDALSRGEQAAPAKVPPLRSRNSALRWDGPARWDQGLLTSGCVLAVLYLVLPDKYLNTIYFGFRFFPWAMVLLVLASPGPQLAPLVKNVVGAAVLAAFSLLTSLHWIRFERDDLDGLTLALDKLPQEASLVGFDFLYQSPSFHSERPFMHLAAYGSVLKSARLNFDFSRHGTGLLRGPIPQDPWTPGIEWAAHWARPSDLRYFQYILVGRERWDNQYFPNREWLRPVTFSGTWRLHESLLWSPDLLDPATAR